MLRDDGTVDNSGTYVQVSRLGNPLINEVIIPLGSKDYWNAQRPVEGQAVPEVLPRRPSWPALVNLLYPALPDARTTSRDDLSLILLTGVPGLNFTGNTPADLLRLNMAIAPTADVGEGDPLGVLNGDLAGFPNGRRLEDDVTDIELRAVADGYGSFLEQRLRPAQPQPEQPGRRRRERERPAVPVSVPVPGHAAPGLRARGSQGWQRQHAADQLETRPSSAARSHAAYEA